MQDITDSDDERNKPQLAQTAREPEEGAPEPDEGSPYTCFTTHSKNEQFKFPSNYIRTTKYKWYTFLPLNLLEQFRKVSNIYFLINMIIALIPGVSPIFPITSILPLVFVVAVACIKDGLEDHKRYKADKKANGKLVTVVRDNRRQQIKSQDLRVGDICRIEKNEEFAADLLVLGTPLEDGICYIETANLDGETNLKRRGAVAITRALKEDHLVNMTEVMVRGEAPNPELAKWEGSATVNNVSKPLGPENMLWRGCKLRNTPHIYAMVVYAGVDTKMFRNLKKNPPKFSGLDKKLNKLIIMLLLFQQTIILILALLSLWFRNDALTKSFYLKYYDDRSPGLQTVLNYLTYFVLLSYMMPISLFVSMELCKAFQAQFMEWDVKMSHGTKTMKAKTSNLNEELSQIKYIFTDKTGTLTENEMRFYRCCIAGYNHVEATDPGGARVHLQSNGAYSDQIREFFTLLAVCHTVVLSPDEKTGEVTYEGDSTDEVALVNAAMSNGFVLKNRTTDKITIEVFGVPETYQVLAICEFNSDRKRMSAVVKKENGTIILMTKGADSIMLPLVNKSNPEDQKWYNNTVKELDGMAREGLRTLVMCQKVLSPSEYESWEKKYHAAKIATKDRRKKCDEVAALIEQDLKLVGGSGIEDRLQDGVPETIHYFIQAGIVIWVLTGDKRETAVNIASSSKLLDINNDSLHHLEARSVDELAKQLSDTRAKVLDECKRGIKVTVVIDGVSLGFALNNLRAEFQDLAANVSSAVCCRVTPKQKADVVALFQDVGTTALAIGDGANDVSMIRQGKVGVGIMGLEGSQAELAADYAIPKFRHLKRLVAVHGRYSLVRNAMLIQYSFYKNMALSLVQVYFAFYNGFSGQTLFDSWVLTFYNIIFTSLPPLIQGTFDKDLDESILERTPSLMRELTTGRYFGINTVVYWGLFAIYHATVIFFFTSSSFVRDDLNKAQISGIWTEGSVTMTVLITVVLVKNGLHYLNWTWIPALSLSLSYAVYYGFILVYSMFVVIFSSGNYHRVSFVLLGSLQFWFWLLLFGIGIMALDLGVLYIQRRWFPSDRDKAIISERAKRSGTDVEYNI